MNNFTYSMPTKLIFGKDTQYEVGKLCAMHSKKVLLHYGSGSIKRSGLYDTVVKSLNENNVDFVELDGVVPNPRLSLVKKGIEICRKENIDFIIAVGGGSVIDSAKAIACGVLYDGDVWDLFMPAKIMPTSAIGIGVVLTIPAAGSETSPNSVITNEEGNFKRGIGGECLIPKFAIMNPELTFTLPANQTANGVSDIFAHLCERYFTNTKDVDYSDRLIEASFRTLIYNAPIAIANPNDYAARAEIMWCGTLAHNGLFDRGRIGDWGSHNIEHELSAMYDIAHGAGLSIVFPAWMKYVYKHDVGRFVQFATRVFDVDIAFTDLEAVALEGIRRLENFFKSIGLPTRLSDLNIDASKLEVMAKMAADRGQFGQFVPLGEQETLDIYKLAL